MNHDKPSLLCLVEECSGLDPEAPIPIRDRVRLCEQVALMHERRGRPLDGKTTQQIVEKVMAERHEREMTQPPRVVMYDNYTGH